MSRRCFACGKFMRQYLLWYECRRCQVHELAEEGPLRHLTTSGIDPDSGEEIFYFDHSAGSWPSPA